MSNTPTVVVQYTRSVTNVVIVVWEYMVSMAGISVAPSYRRRQLILCRLSYANSVLQALYFCQPFRDLVCSTPDPFREVFPPPQPPPATPAGAKPTVAAPATPSEAPPPAATTPPPLPPPPTLFSALRSLYLHISTHHHTKGVVSPASFIAKLKKENELFRGSMHQDAHEFLNFLLNKIVEDLQSEQYAQVLDVPEKVSGPQDVDLRASSACSVVICRLF